MGTDRDGVLKTRGDKHNGRRHHLQPIIAFGAGYFFFNAYFCVPNIHFLVPTPLTAFYKNTLANVEQSATLRPYPVTCQCRHPTSITHSFSSFTVIILLESPSVSIRTTTIQAVAGRIYNSHISFPQEKLAVYYAASVNSDPSHCKIQHKIFQPY